VTQKKVALITGGTNGIGFAAARTFGVKGYSVCINGHNKERGEQACHDLKSEGIDAHFLLADVTDEDQVNTMVAQAGSKLGGIDVLVNNAGGLGGRSKISEMTTEFWDHVLDLNLKSTFFCTRAAIPYIPKSSESSIINVTSIAAYNGGGPGATAYAVSKAAILAFTRGLAKELIPEGIRVNAVSPGTIDTAFHSATAKDIIEKWRQGIPIKRLGEPSEIADVIYYLASNEASFLVGEIIQVNGGQMMQ